MSSQQKMSKSIVYRLVEWLQDEQSRNVSYFEGRLLTILDAVVSDPEQRKATKDLVRNLLGDLRYDYSMKVIVDPQWYVFRQLAEKIGDSDEYEKMLGPQLGSSLPEIQKAPNMFDN